LTVSVYATATLGVTARGNDGGIAAVIAVFLRVQYITGPLGIPVLKAQNSPAKEKISANARSLKCLILHALTQ